VEQITSITEKGQTPAEMAMLRLADEQLMNLTLRREILPSLSQVVFKSQEALKSAPESWQKHSFSIDGGKQLNMSVREVDGIMILRVASSSPEIARILQQYEQDIRRHLEQECQIRIDLQLNDQGSQNPFAQFDETRQINRTVSQSDLRTSQNHVNSEISAPRVRNFGYNRMEWTA
jgi:hypothetical protein